MSYRTQVTIPIEALPGHPLNAGTDWHTAALRLGLIRAAGKRLGLSGIAVVTYKGKGKRGYRFAVRISKPEALQPSEAALAVATLQAELKESGVKL